MSDEREGLARWCETWPHELASGDDARVLLSDANVAQLCRMREAVADAIRTALARAVARSEAGMLTAAQEDDEEMARLRTALAASQAQEDALRAEVERLRAGLSHIVRGGYGAEYVAREILGGSSCYTDVAKEG